MSNSPHPELSQLLKELALQMALLSKALLGIKTVLNAEEAAQYLSISLNHLYKLTSAKEVPFYCPNGKKLYFDRAELDIWLKRGKSAAISEIETHAATHLVKKGGRYE